MVRYSQLGSVGIKLAFALLASFGVFASRNALRQEVTSYEVHEQPQLYLPEEKYVRLTTMGFNNFTSDLLWFNTINYFGKQLRGTRDYQWLSNMCNLVTSLDPKKAHVFEFCANMLAWEAKDFDKSIAILDHAVASNPDSWKFLYIRGFNQWYFFQNTDKAVADLEAAASKPNAPAFLASLASRLMIHNNNVDTAVTFLEKAVQNATDDSAKQVLTDRYKRAVLARDLQALQGQVTHYTEKLGSAPSNLQALVDAHYLKFVPKDPFGGEYQIDNASGKIISTSGEKPLEFHGKTKDTGIFGMENAQDNTLNGTSLKDAAK